MSALAVGPDQLLDGLWAVTISNPSLGTFQSLASVHQTDALLPAGFNVAMIVLEPEGVWWFALGTRVGTTVSGTLFLFDGRSIGTFTITVSDRAFSGQAVELDTPLTVSGSKLF
jgi:hypothetical protein